MKKRWVESMLCMVLGLTLFAVGCEERKPGESTPKPSAQSQGPGKSGTEEGTGSPSLGYEQQKPGSEQKQPSRG